MARTPVRPPPGALRAGHGWAGGEGGWNLSGRHVRARRACARRARAIGPRRPAAADGQGSRGDRGGRTRVRRGPARRDPARQFRRPGAVGCDRRRPRRRAARPRRVLAAARCRRARLQLRQGRPARHAHGPRHRRKRRAMAGARRRPRDRRRAVDLRRGAHVAPDRPRHRRAPRRAADHPHRAVGRTDRVGDAARRQQDPSGDAQLPGDPHLHQPRAGRPRNRARRRAGAAEARRPPRRDQLPFAGRPHRQAVHRAPRQGAAGQPAHADGARRSRRRCRRSATRRRPTPPRLVANPRARSAVLRVAEKLAAAGREAA